jgi:alpha-glucosidase (family GH31 glycosyl hydrolase)
MQTIPIADNEQGVFIREGAIIPLLNYEPGRMSLLEAWDDPIHLLIYPYVGGGSIYFDTASGDMYLDDGESNNYLNKEYSWVYFSWSGALTATRIAPNNASYAKASGKFINKATVYNVRTPPTKVKNTYVSNMAGQNETFMDFIYNEEASTVTVHNFFIPID